MNRKGSRVYRTLVGTVVAGLVIAMGFATVHARQPQKASLVATSVTPQAKGWTVLHGGQGGKATFTVVAHRLTPSASFDVVVDGVKVASLTTNGGGNGKVRFRTTPHGKDLLLGFDPQGADVVIRDHDGHDCLSGHGGHPGDSASGACCLPDRDGDGDAHCASIDAATCIAKGGIVPSSATSCFPNPCATQPPADAVTCCIPESAHGAFSWHDEDDDVDCRIVSGADCANKGGTVVTATSCHPNPCAPVPPANLVACCVTEHEGDTDCKQLTTERCTSLGGSAAGAFCDPNPCGGEDGDGDGGHDHGHGGDGHGDGGHGRPGDWGRGGHGGHGGEGH